MYTARTDICRPPFFPFTSSLMNVSKNLITVPLANKILLILQPVVCIRTKHFIPLTLTVRGRPSFLMHVYYNATKETKVYNWIRYLEEISGMKNVWESKFCAKRVRMRDILIFNIIYFLICCESHHLLFMYGYHNNVWNQK